MSAQPARIDVSGSDVAIANAYARNSAIRNVGRVGKGSNRRPYDARAWARNYAHAFKHHARRT